MQLIDDGWRPLTRAFGLILALTLVDASFAWAGSDYPRITYARSGIELVQQQGKSAPSAAPGAKADPAHPAEEVAAWAVTCTDQGQKKFACEMTQSLIDQKTSMQVVLISIKSVATGESKAMLIRFFHGVYLPTGVSVKVDGGQATPIAFQKSDRLGVYAALPLNDRIIADMKRGKELRFSVQINQGEALEVVARLNGFGPAYDRLSSVH